MQTVEKTLDGQTFTFAVTTERDHDHGAPWEEHDGHGPVTDWECRDHYKGGKLPGELILASDGRGNYRFYDYAEACKIALRDGWDAKPYNDGTQTKRQQAAKAARADYEYLRAWCEDQWQYVCVTVTLLDDQGEETDVYDVLGGVEDNDDGYIGELGETMAGELLAGYGKTWVPSWQLIKTYSAKGVAL